MLILFRQSVRIVGVLFTFIIFQLAGRVVVFAQTPEPKAGLQPKALSRLIAPSDVDRLIITPNTSHGRQLTEQLERRNDSHLASIAEVPLRIERRLSGKAHLIQLDKAVSAEEARSLAAKLTTHREIESAEPDVIMQAHGVTPNDPSYSGSPGQ